MDGSSQIKSKSPLDKGRPFSGVADDEASSAWHNLHKAHGWLPSNVHFKAVAVEYPCCEKRTTIPAHAIDWSTAQCMPMETINMLAKAQRLAHLEE